LLGEHAGPQDRLLDASEIIDHFALRWSGHFGQIQIGDQVKVTLTEEAAVFIGRGAPPSAMVGTGVALAPVGAKPGGVLVDTMQLTVKVTAVDAKARKVTFELPDGTSKKVKVGKKVDLAAVKPGDNVTVLVSEGLAITVEKYAEKNVYAAIGTEGEIKWGAAKVNPAACFGCGICVAECPAKAITLRHLTDEQIYAQMNLP
jgi:NAD-dependent dihydropyrimidine dehydrogenase PreA subunit